MRHSLAKTVTPREVWAWAMYDFANSGYTTVVITAIFNAYFVSVVAGNQPWATFAWTAALAVSYAAIMFTAPVIGAYADAYAAKKKLLALTTIGCVAFTAMLAFSGPGSLWLTIPLIVLSNFFYGSGENLIAAFLPELATGRSLGKVSGWGMEPGLCRRPGEPGRLPRLCDLGAGTWPSGCGFRARDDADHRRAVRDFQLTHLPVPQGTRRAAAAFAGAEPDAGIFRATNANSQAREGLPRPAALSDLHGVLPNGHPGGDHARGHLRTTGDALHHPADHHAYFRGKHHRRDRRISVRPSARSHRPYSHDRIDAGRLDRHGRTGMGRTRP
jgi:hypothetical protein